MSNTEMGKIAQRLGGRLAKISLNEIEVGERYRQDYGDLNELALSLKERGQLQNLVVKENPDSGLPFKLLAGGRRFKTMTEKLEWTDAFALIFPRDLSDLEMLEIEWEENCRRRELKWEEDVAIKRKICELRLAQFGERIGDSKDSPGTSLRATAEELGVSAATMSQDVSLAKAAEACPELFKGCKTKKEAQKILAAATQQLARAELAKRAEASVPSESQLRSVIERYIICDFFEGVAGIPDKCIHFVEIDPPYAVALQDVKKLKDVRYSLNAYNEVDINDYRVFIAKTLLQCHRVMTEHAYGILWFAPEPWAEIMYQLICEAGFETTRLTGKWIKPGGQTNRPERYLANASEDFYYFWKGSPTIVRQGRTNIFQYTPIAGTKKVHPTERPLEMMQEILSTFCFEGSRIMVPFLGSGKTILAAETLKMKAFGYELSSTYRDAFVVAASEMFGGSNGTNT